jgi:hypothetical protein
MASKKQGTSALAGSPIDVVSAAGFVWVAQILISCDEFSRIYWELITNLSGLRKAIN